ncbi:hypothetical protein NKH77_03410 [Streptomyces sp. M19]
MAASLDGRRADQLPAGTDSFIGRHDELTVIGTLLTSARLVTLTGPGGVGKSGWRSRPPSGRAGTGPVRYGSPSCRRCAIRRCSPAPSPRPSGPPTSRGSPNSTRSPTARHERLLLVLDTCEHVLAECARVVERLLAAVPGLRVLATSRQPLGIAEEHVLTVSPLPVHHRDGGRGARSSCSPPAPPPPRRASP